MTRLLRLLVLAIKPPRKAQLLRDLDDCYRQISAARKALRDAQDALRVAICEAANRQCTLPDRVEAAQSALHRIDAALDPPASPCR